MNGARIVRLASIIAIVAAVAVANAEPGKPGPGPGAGFGPGHGKGGWAAIANDLTPDQQKQIQTLKIETMKKTEDLRSQLAKKRIDLMELASKGTPDEQVIQQKTQEIWALQDAKRNEHRAFATKLRALLTPEQRQKLGPLGSGMGMGMGMGGRGGHGFGKHGHRGCAGCPAGPGGPGCVMGDPMSL